MNRELGHDELRMYLLAVCLVAVADHKVVGAEIDQLKQIGAVLDIEEDECEKILEKATNNASCVRELGSVKESEVGRIIYRDCLLMATADREIHPKERLMLESIRMNLGISEELAARFDTWMEEGFSWQKRGDRLVRDGI